VQATDDRAQRVRLTGTGTVAIAAVPLSVALIGGVLIVAGIGNGGSAPIATGGIVLGLVVFVAALVAPQFRPVAVLSDELLLPEGIRKTRRLPLRDIAGIGLLYIRPSNTRAGEGWYLFVWERSGTNYVVGNVRLTSGRLPTPPGERTPAVWLRANRPKSWPLKNENAALLAKSRAGLITRRLDELIRDRQGPAGALARLELQKRPAPARPDVIETLAWWAADGTMAREAS
jgi:hypothetical protein